MSIRTNSETLNKLRFDHEKLSDEINQAELRYKEFNEALEGVQDKLRDAKVRLLQIAIYEALMRLCIL